MAQGGARFGLSAGRRAAIAATALALSTLPNPPMHPDYLPLLLSREMPYGKYKGRVIADLPAHYLAWFAREGFPSASWAA